MDILPKIGAGPLRFGMTRDVVAGLLGEPEEREIEGEEGSRTEDWSYDDGDIEITFYEDEEWRLGSLTLETAVIDGVDPVGLGEFDGLRALRNAGVPRLTLEDERRELGVRELVCAEYDFSLFVLDGVIRSVTVFPEYTDDGGTPLWPGDLEPRSGTAG